MATWYRYWLELRLPLLIAVAGIAVSAWKYASAIGARFAQLQADGVADGLRQFESLVPPMGPEWVIVWGTHAGLCLTVAMMLPWIVSGTGIGDTSFASSFSDPTRWPTSRGTLYTLSLPMSRFRLIWTRLTALALATLVVFGVQLAAHVGVLLVLGHAAPVWPMAAASLASALLCVTFIAILSLVLIARVWMWLLPVPFVVMVVTTFSLGQWAVIDSVQTGVSLGLVAVVALVVLASVTFSRDLVESQEI